MQPGNHRHTLNIAQASKVPVCDFAYRCTEAQTRRSSWGFNCHLRHHRPSYKKRISKNGSYNIASVSVKNCKELGWLKTKTSCCYWVKELGDKRQELHIITGSTTVSDYKLFTSYLFSKKDLTFVIRPLIFSKSVNLIRSHSKSYKWLESTLRKKVRSMNCFIFSEPTNDQHHRNNNHYIVQYDDVAPSVADYSE